MTGHGQLGVHSTIRRIDAMHLASPLFVFAQCIRHGSASDGDALPVFQTSSEFIAHKARTKALRLKKLDDAETAVAIVQRFFRELSMPLPAGVCVVDFTEVWQNDKRPDERRPEWIIQLGRLHADNAVRILRAGISIVSDHHLAEVEKVFNHGVQKLLLIPDGAAAVAAHGVSTFAPGGLKRLLVAFATPGQPQQLPWAVQPVSSTGLSQELLQALQELAME